LNLNLVVFSVFLGMAVLLMPMNDRPKASGATLYLSPTSGSFVSESTFDVSIMVNTGGQAINAVTADLTFSPDELQIVGPDSSSSFISVWIAQPTFSNNEGKINLVGGLPTPGINSSAGNILTIKFRAKSAGKATISFTSASKILANDGSGTDILSSSNNATYNITPQPPAGPNISSTTHPDQNSWYSNRAPQFNWESPGVQAISYIYDKSPNTEPDVTAEAMATTISSTADSDGAWFFHLRVEAGGAWGGTSHFKTQIDATAPAKFTPLVNPSRVSLNQRPIVTFQTTDAMSGVDHYEIKVESRDNNKNSAGFFTEQQSPYILPVLEPGKYQVVVKAYDKAGNTVEGTAQIEIIGSGASDWLHNIWVLIGLALAGLVIIAVIIWLVIRRRRRRRGRELLMTTNQYQNQGNNYPPNNNYPNYPA